MRLFTVVLERETDVVFARRRARSVAELLGFDRQDQTRIATGVSEIARNALEYGGGGRMEVAVTGTSSPQELEIRIVDKGPGIADLEAVLRGEHRSALGLGKGLVGTSRLVDRFSIKTKPGDGTSVTFGKRMPRNAPLFKPAELQAVVDKLANQEEPDPLREFQQQSQELLVSLEEQRHAQDALRRLNDTLEQRVMEKTAELRESQESLVQARKIEALGQMTGAVAHDFNNVLAVIIGNLELLQLRLDADPRMKKWAADAERAAFRGQKMVQDLLAFARKQPLAPQVLDVERVVTGLEEAVRQLLPEGIRLELVLAPNLQSAFIDQNQLERAVLNLVVNGRDAIHSGEGIVTVEAETASLDSSVLLAEGGEAKPGTYVRLTIRDNGVGMPLEVRRRAFEPFFTTKPVGQGTGLGLSQVYGFIRQSKGHVTIESDEGVGTAIHLFLPTAVQD